MVKPHGGVLIDRTLPKEKKQRLSEESKEMPKIAVNNELAKDIENIVTGVLSPLEGFVGREDYTNILSNKRLANDLPWTIPITLDASNDDLKNIKVRDDIMLTNKETEMLAILHINEIYDYDKKELAEQVYGTTDADHPGVAKTKDMKENLIGGKIDLIMEPKSPYPKFHLKPIETRILFKEKGWRDIVAFQTRNPPHIGHEYVQKAALTFVDGILINPLIGKKKIGDFKDEVILNSYNALIEHYYLKERAVLSTLETEMRYGGPREAIFHAIMRKNFGCTHFIVGRDHAGVGNYYSPYAAHDIFEEFPDLEIVPLFFKSFSYCNKCGSVVNEKICPHEKEFHVNFSGTKIRSLITEGKKPDEMLMRPEVADIILKYEKPFVE